MNNTIFFFFYNLAHQSQLFDQIVIFFSFHFPFAVIFLAGIFLLMHHEVFKADSPFQVFMQKKKEILLVFFTGAIAWVIAVILKNLFHLERPFLALPDIHPLLSKTTFSFPSEHAMFFSALALSIFFLHKKAGYVFMFFALIIGIARIIAGVHFPLDILCGLIFGAIVALLAKKI